MKKVVVVVDENHTEIFHGNNLEVDLRADNYSLNPIQEGPQLLIVKEGDTILAHFRTWMYWREG